MSKRDYVAIGTQYARDVVSGAIPACKWVRAACQRQLADLERKDWQWTFDPAKANKICIFAELMPHVKGRWGSPTIVLEPWQCFIFTTVFGWVHRETGLRRFRKALVIIPARNGKSVMGAITGLYLLAVDGEPGAEVYSAATTRDQAKIVWDTARIMVARTEAFRRKFGVEALAHSIAIEDEGSWFKALSRDANSLEGLNAHGVIIDELHAHKTREVYDVLEERTGSRNQPLTLIVSTEGDNPTGVFAEQRTYAENILGGIHQDDSYFGIVYTIDSEIDWTTQEAWEMANPNYGVSVKADSIRMRCMQAQRNPAAQSSFLTKRLNVRVGAMESYFNMLAWDRLCRIEGLQIEDFANRRCVVAIDLANKSDLTAKVTLFDRGAAFVKFYLPEDAVERGNPNYDFYRGWVAQGYLTLTPGNETDFEFIERDLLEDVKNFEVRMVAYDTFQARQFSQRMRKQGVPMVEVNQTVGMMNAPMQDLAARIVAGKIQHDGNPVLSWCMGNVVAKKDAKDNVYPRKSLGREENKIDGAVCLIMARAAQMMQPAIADSIYNDPMTCVI